MMFYDHDHISGWGYALMTISMVLFWALIIGAVVILVRYFARTDRQTGGLTVQQPSAEHVLAERFARGEIDEQEYRRRLDVLRAGAQPKP